MLPTVAGTSCSSISTSVSSSYIYYEFAGNPDHTITVTMDTVLKKAAPEVADYPDVPKIPNSEGKLTALNENWEEDLLNLASIKIKP